MFTGIIQTLGRISQIEKSPESVRARIETGFRDLVLGESVAVNGVCLTVAELSSSQRGDAVFFISPETLARTNLGDLVLGSRVNLERALLASERLSGHIVQGHVDGLAKLKSSRQVGESWELAFEIPSSLSRYCVEKGSITINGISLTINSLGQAGEVRVMIIPHTWTHTDLSTLSIGQAVNIEVDVIAKYVEKLCQPYKSH